jgi:hypothetical protein
VNTIPQVGQTVWIIEYRRASPKVVKDVCTSDGKPYQPKHGDDCYVRFERHRGSRWYRANLDVFSDERKTKAALAEKLREEAAALVRLAAELESEAVS